MNKVLLLTTTNPQPARIHPLSESPPLSFPHFHRIFMLAYGGGRCSGFAARTGCLFLEGSAKTALGVTKAPSSEAGVTIAAAATSCVGKPQIFDRISIWDKCRMRKMGWVCLLALDCFFLLAFLPCFAGVSLRDMLRYFDHVHDVDQ